MQYDPSACGDPVYQHELLAPLTAPLWQGAGLAWVETVAHEMCLGSHTVEHHAIALIDAGVAQAEFGHRRKPASLDLGPGSIGYFAPGTYLRYSNWRWREARRIVFTLDPGSLSASGLLESRGSGAPATDLQFRDDDLAAVLRSLASETAAGSPHGRLYSESLSLGVALRLQQRAAQRASTRHERGKLSPQQVQRVEELVRAHLARNLSLAMLADAAGFSPAQFVRLFRKTLGCSPHGYVQRLRLERARELVVSTTSPLASIAEEAGFSSQSHMTSCFAKAFDVRPGEMRRLARRGV